MRYNFWMSALLLCLAHAAFADEVSCDDISIKFQAPGFTQHCEERIRQGQGTSRIQILDASSSEQQSFLYAIAHITRAGFYFMMPDFKEAVAENFSTLNIKDWQEGRETEGFKVAEFNGTVSGLPSLCIAFQGRQVRSPGGGGFSRYSLGISCTTDHGKLDALYANLKNLKL